MSNPRITVDELLSTLQQRPDFERVKAEFNSVPTLVGRIEYIDRKIYEEHSGYVPLLHDLDANRRFQQRLETIGMPLLCPHLRLEGANRTTHQDCMITGDPVYACCDGRADICKVYQAHHPDDPWPWASSPCLVDLQDQNDWWRQEGKYGDEPRLVGIAPAKPN